MTPRRAHSHRCRVAPDSRPTPSCNDRYGRCPSQNTTECPPSRFERPDGAVRRLGHAGRVFRHHRRTPGRARRGPASSTSATWAKSRLPARTRWRRCSGSPATMPAASRWARSNTAALLTPEGTFIDDMLVMRMAPNHFLLVVNAANAAKDYAWIAEQIKPAGDAAAVDTSSRYALIAIQGPAAREVLQPLTGVESRRPEVLLVRLRRSRERPRHHLPHRLHRRRRVSRSSCRRTWPIGSGRPCSRPAVPQTSFPAASAPATRFGSKRRCGCTATTSTSPPGARSRPGLDGRLEEERLHRRRAAAASRRTKGVTRKLSASRCSIAASPGMGIRWCRRDAHRRGDQRHADAVLEEGHRHGLCAGGARRTRHRPRHRRPRPRLGGACRPCRSTRGR